jgi:hypothetical protein
MKKMMKTMMLLASTAAMTSCNSSDPYSEFTDYGNYAGGTSAYTGGGSSAATGELTTFDVAIDRTSAEPTESAADAYYPNEKDVFSAGDYTTRVAIDLSAPVASTADGVTITVDGAHVIANHATTKNVCYVVSGSTHNGSLTILGDQKYEVLLNGVDIVNPDSAALNLLSGSRAFVVAAEGTSNTLADGTSSKNDHKGALYCKGKLILSGSGLLDVSGSYNNAIHSADYVIFSEGCNVYAKSTANHGVKANDGIFINGGIVNVEVTAAAAKGLNSESHIMVNGGRTTVLTTGGGTYDSDDREAKGAACIKADSTFTQNGGVLLLKSTGAGGKGINVDMDADFTGGQTYIVTTGGQYSANGDTSSPKGIKTDGAINIGGGTIWVRTSGKNGEGIETKSTLTITGGEVASYAYDDAINSKSTMNISGGYVFAQGRNNDGLDANGNLYIKGGTVYAVCSGSPEVAIDANTEGGYKLYVEGGTIVAVGGLENGSSLSQQCYQASSWNRSAWYALTSGDTTFAFLTPQSGGSGIVVSTASAPSLQAGVSLQGGTSLFGGLGQYGSTASGGSSVTLSSYSGGGMGGGMMGGGGRPF